MLFEKFLPIHFSRYKGQISHTGIAMLDAHSAVQEEPVRSAPPDTPQEHFIQTLKVKTSSHTVIEKDRRLEGKGSIKKRSIESKNNL